MIDIADAISDKLLRRAANLQDRIRQLLNSGSVASTSAAARMALEELRRRQLLDELQRKDSSEEKRPSQNDIARLLSEQDADAIRREAYAERVRSVTRRALRSSAFTDAVIPIPTASTAEGVIRDPDGMVRYVVRQDGEIVRI